MPFMLASTVMGYLLGTAVPSAMSMVLHPLVTCALVTNVAAFAHSAISGRTFESIVRAYLAKVCMHMTLSIMQCSMHKEGV